MLSFNTGAREYVAHCFQLHQIGWSIDQYSCYWPFDATANYGIARFCVAPLSRGKVRFAVNPPFELEFTCLDEIRNLSNAINHRHGFDDLTLLSPEDTETVRSDEAFWREFLRVPYFVVAMAIRL